ncbi:GNAT family N-acetyltransferase [Pandoraea anhela]|uniref:GNAT family N-acetyltransferase n=2 Tax=Pandoraea anhela TaxID=2508295 RepID=A0A5E4RBQ8_9BURK|nr:GNAT family N-acetyltransferase [Pandoraea anhela]
MKAHIDKIRIRPARVLDIDAVTKIYGCFVTQETTALETSTPSTHEMLHRHGEACRIQAPFLVAVYDSTVIGFALSDPFGKQGGYRYALVYSMYVIPEFRKRGVGGRLMKSLIEAATGSGFRSMIAAVCGEAPPAVCRLHARFGFSPVGALRAAGFRHGRMQDVSLFQLSLPGVGLDISAGGHRPDPDVH